MSSLNDILSGFALIADPFILLVLLIGVVVCTLIVAVPGLGGAFVLVLLIPFAIRMDPVPAIALLIGGSVVSGTGNVITSILFGVPGSSMGVATILDGYPMAKKGEAARAFGAAFTASAFGGIIGAVALVLLIPIVRPIVFALGPPEFFILVALALLFMAFIGNHDTLNALVSGCLGLLIAFVGLQQSTAIPRYTFGQLYLWDGIKLVPFLVGLFAISEMLRLATRRESVAGNAAEATNGLFQGIKDVFVRWPVSLVSSIAGVIVGLIPGLGGETAQYVAYYQGQRVSKEPEKFGKGSVDGVIASDSATNSKDGGALLTTLLLGVPGSSGMAILLVILVTIGVEPGPAMLKSNADILWFIIALLVVANIFGTILCLIFARPIAKATKVKYYFIVGPVFVCCFFAAYVDSFQIGDIVVMLGSGLLGYFLLRFGYPRTTLVIGFVLGGILEKNYLLSDQLYGWSFLYTRPIATSMLVATVVFFVARACYSIVRRRNHDKVISNLESSRVE